MSQLSTTEIHSRRPNTLIALLLTLVLAVISIYLNPIINNDGIEYLASANAMVEGDWGLAIQKYKWPFYPGLIAVFIKLGMDQMVAAWFVDIVLQLLAAAAFIRVFHQLALPKTHHIWVYLLVIAAPALDNYRWMLIRDYGFLAGWLWGLSFILQSVKDGQARLVKTLIAFGFALCFRVEALLLILTLPIIRTIDQRSLVRSICYTLVIAVSVSLLSGFWLSNDGFYAGLKTGDWSGVFEDGWQGIIGTIETTRLRLEKYILRHELSHLATPMFYISIFLMVLWSFVKLVQFPYIVLVLWSNKRFGRSYTETERRILLSYFVLFLSLMLIYAFLRYYSTERYALPAWSVFALFIPIATANLWQWGQSHEKPWARYMVYALVVIATGYILRTSFSSSNRLHLREAGQWVKNNIPNESRIFTGNRIVVFYSERPRDKTRIYEPYEAFLFASARDVWVGYDYVVAEIYSLPDDDRVNQFNDYYQTEPFKIFTNNRHNTVAIYDVRHFKPTTQ